MARIVRDIAQTVLLAVVLFVALRGLVQTFRVEQHSMEPTIQDGQYLLVNRLAYVPAWLRERPVERALPALRAEVGLLTAPMRGDIVVVRHPHTPETQLVKRVIGLPDETIEVRDGVVFVDGRALEEPYLRQRTNYRYAPRRIGPGEIFVLGDNRNNSYDSHLFGPIPSRDLVGKAIWVGASPTAFARQLQQALAQALN
jgi:signal peptidase I